MRYVYFSNTGNFDSPIIESEFVKNVDDAKIIFMQADEFKKDVIQGVDNQNLVDYTYMLAYTALLILVFIKISELENKKIYSFGITFAVIAIVGDVVENIQLFKISELLTARIDFSSEIKTLIISTSVKWLSLGFAMFILSFHYFKYKIIGKIFALLSSIPLLIAIVYIFTQSLKIELLYTTSIMVGFVLLMIWSFISKYINKSTSFYKEVQD